MKFIKIILFIFVVFLLLFFIRLSLPSQIDDAALREEVGVRW